MFVLFNQKFNVRPPERIVVNSNLISLIEETSPGENLFIYLSGEDRCIEVTETLDDLKNIPAFKHMFE